MSKLTFLTQPQVTIDNAKNPVANPPTPLSACIWYDGKGGNKCTNVFLSSENVTDEQQESENTIDNASTTISINR